MLYKHDMVTGMKLDLTTLPDPVCEPCLAGKMHANPFPSSEWCARPLELMHTDVHMLVKINHKRALLCLVSETEEKRLWARKFQLHKQSKQGETKENTSHKSCDEP